jgi:hypothetical protein
MSQWFAPTRLKVTFEMEGQGKLTEEDIQRVVVRNKAGDVIGLKLPNKAVIIANHQANKFMGSSSQC